MVWKPFYCRMNILHRLWQQEQYYTAFLGGFAAMPLTSGIIKRLIRFIRNKYRLTDILISQILVLYARYVFYCIIPEPYLHANNFYFGILRSVFYSTDHFKATENLTQSMLWISAYHAKTVADIAGCPVMSKQTVSILTKHSLRQAFSRLAPSALYHLKFYALP